MAANPLPTKNLAVFLSKLCIPFRIAGLQKFVAAADYITCSGPTPGYGSSPSPLQMLAGAVASHICYMLLDQ